MGIALFVVLERDFENLDLFVDGKMLAKGIFDLDERAKVLNIKPLSEFYGYDPNEVIENFEIENLETLEKLEETWFEANDGLKTIDALIEDLQKSSISIIYDRDIAKDVLEDLKGIREILNYADKNKIKWYLAADF